MSRPSFFSISEAAALLRLPDDRVARWCELGKRFPGASKSTAHGWRIPRADVERIAGKDLEQLYTLKETAELLGFAYLTIFRWVKAGKFKGATLIEGSWRIPESDIEAKQAAGRVFA